MFGDVSMLLASLYFIVMMSGILQEDTEPSYFILENCDYLPLLKDLSEDRSVPLAATTVLHIIKHQQGRSSRSALFNYPEQPKWA
jgi:hypothetical protein